jgi:hypothetical protein
MIVLAVLTLSGGVSVARAESAPPPPPELKKTVDAFVGKWVYETTVTMPGGKPVKTKLSVDCRKTALGKAVSCLWSGNIPGDGPFEGTAVLGFDTSARASTSWASSPTRRSTITSARGRGRRSSAKL